MRQVKITHLPFTREAELNADTVGLPWRKGKLKEEWRLRSPSLGAFCDSEMEAEHVTSA